MGSEFILFPYLKLGLSRWGGRGLLELYALNGVKGHFGKCFVTSFISSLVKKRKEKRKKIGERKEGGRKEKEKCKVKAVPSRLFERWVETREAGEEPGKCIALSGRKN